MRDVEYVRAVEQCKGVLRHAWYPTTTDRTAEFGTYIANQCERCGHVRLMAVGSHGQIISKWRYIPQDKVLYKSVTVESRDEWRSRYLMSLGIGGRKAQRAS